MSSRRQRTDVPPDEARIAAEVAQGGLAVYEDAAERSTDGGTLLHLVPHEVANALRFFVSRMQPEAWEGDNHTLAVTSSLLGEGVTSVARSLAAVLANDLERTVCLVETNWWSAPEVPPTAEEATGNPGPGAAGRPGLAAVLSGSTSIDEALTRTSDHRLVVLTAGEMPVGKRPAAVSGGSLHDVFETLVKDYDTVVIDVPPVLTTSEASAIAREASGTILVVQRGVTTEQQVQTAIEELEGAHVLGVIVNRSPARVPRVFRRLGLPL